MILNKLTPEEEKIITGKGTEAPYSGEYDNFFANGVYTCRRCGAPLYTSDSKFDAHCGWPAFDSEISGRVKRAPTVDGQGVEISCAACGAHLGHVFTGENMTPKDTRHCVNSVSLKFIPQSEMKKSEIAVLGGGCFWCLEPLFKQVKGVSRVLTGYAGGRTANPTYDEVSGGATGHAEVVKIDFDPMMATYRELLRIFFDYHDPTTLNQQGNDMGEQYRSLILYADQGQKLIAEDYIKELTANRVFNQPIVTEIKPLADFYQAEDSQQDYYAKHPENAYCRVVIKPKLEKFMASRV